MKRNQQFAETYLHPSAAASTALTTLRGLLDGIICDQEINDLERATVLNWIDEYSFLKGHPAMSSVFDYLAESLADNILSIQEVEDIQWMIEKNLRSFYDETTQKVQVLIGLLSGIAADVEIRSVEFKHLWDWLNENEDLKGIFPYDEIYSIVCQIGTRRAMTDAEKRFLVTAFSLTNQEAALAKSPFFPWEIDPEVSFSGREFCLTGVSKKARRTEIVSAIEGAGGVVAERVTQKLNYLIVCAEPNRAWTHACYGRKIEEAIRLRKRGFALSIVGETDLWDAFKG